jgi:type I restriction enzyme, S subunit
MAKYQKYAEYQDSGIEWLGEIPSHWFNTKVKYEAYVKARVGWHGLKSDDFTDEGPYLVTGSDFKGTNIDWSQCYHCDEPRYEQDPYIQLRDGDLLITKDGTIGKVALVSNLKNGEKATLNSGIFVVRPLRNNFSTKFYFWLLQSKVFKEFVDFNKTGSTIVHLYQDTFVNFEYASPNLKDQIQIANFLDYETAQIDSLIAKQEKLIELLKEKRQAVISHVVTKGLNPDIAMKDSGVEWLGQVPEHWIVKPNKYLLDFVTSGSRGWAQYYADTGSLFFRIANLTRDTIEPKLESLQFVEPPKGSEGERSKIKIGDLLISITADLGSVCVADSAIQNGYVSQHVALCRPQKKYDSRWLAYYILSDSAKEQLLGSGYGGTKIQLSLEDIKELIIVVPPKDEQILIANYIDEKLNQFEYLIKQANNLVTILQERRTALISSAVTGKIDVRHWQNPNKNNDAKSELGA